MRGDIRFEHAVVEPNGPVAHGDQTRLRARVGARKQRYIVAQIDKGIAEIRNDALCAAVERRRHGFVEWCDLCNPQLSVFHCCILK
jgi:hypothetical protein